MKASSEVDLKVRYTNCCLESDWEKREKTERSKARKFRIGLVGVVAHDDVDVDPLLQWLC